MTLQNVIPAYAYQEYGDDDDVQAFFTALNGMAQTYVTWMNDIVLPYYPGLSGDLLTWVAQGLYGQPRAAQLQAAVGSPVGPLGTVLLGTKVLGYYAFPTTTYYNVTDDLFQRILTWNFYKADGKRFCMRWIKRRIARFVFGTNGVDPNPVSATFVIGAENTSAISVQVASSVLTVQINQSLLSAQTQLTPNILSLFKLAFLGGLLELPAQYTYAVNIITQLIASVSPTHLQVAGNAANLTTKPATVTAAQGSGSYTYAWTMASEIGAVIINSPSSAVTTFSANGLILGQGVGGIAQCVVTDTVTSSTATVSLTVNIARASQPVVTLSPTSASAIGANNDIVTPLVSVSIAGGTAPFTYQWTFTSGGGYLQISAPQGSQTTFAGINVPAGTTSTGTAQVTVTDFFGLTASATCAVSVQRVSAPKIVLSPTSLSVTSDTASLATAVCNATISQDAPPYSYVWSWLSGGTNITINSPSASGTSFSTAQLAPGQTFTGTIQCRVMDSYNQSANATASVSLSRVTLVSASVLPASVSNSGVATSLSAGPATVTASGGAGPYTYAWTWVSNPGLSITNPNAAATSFVGSNLTNGTTYSGVAKCVVTDFYGQTVAVTVSVSIVCEASLFTYTAQNATTQVIPNNSTQVVIEGWGPGGYGGAGAKNAGEGIGGGGGGAGGYFRKTLGLTSAAWNKTISVSSTQVDTGLLTVSSGTFAIPTLTASQGVAGGTGASNPRGGTGGAGGTASGGDVNTTGGAGGNGDAFGDPGDPGLAVNGINGGPYGGGGLGGSPNNPTTAGYAGQAPGVIFNFSSVNLNIPSVSIAPAKVTVVGGTSTLTTSALTATGTNGKPPYTYAWSWQQGGTGIAINSPSSAATTFTATTITNGQTFAGVAQCKITDSAGQSGYGTATVQITRGTLVSVTITPTAATASGIASSQTTNAVNANASGGSGVYTYKWKLLTSNGIVITTPTASSTTFSATGLVAGKTYANTAEVTVTDSYGQVSTATVSVSITCINSLLALTNQAATVVTVPNQASSVVIEGWGPGGYGGAGAANAGEGIGGGGGGAGGYFRKTIAVTSANWGQTFNVSSTAANTGALTVTAGTLAVPSMTASQGAAGGPGSANRRGGVGGAGGTASGGDVNTTGGAGGNGDAFGDPGDPGLAVNGINGGPYGAGGDGGSPNNATTNGAAGAPAGAVVKFS